MQPDQRQSRRKPCPFPTCPASATISRPRALPGSLPQGQKFAAAAAPTGSMPSSSPARPSPRRAAPTSAPGFTASGRASGTPAASRCRAIRCWKSAPNVGDHELPLGQLRWNPAPMPDAEPTDFLSGMRTMTTAGDAFTQVGMAAHVYVANRLDDRRSFLQRRWRAADRAAGRRHPRRHRDGRHRGSSRASSASSRAAWSSRSS